jgi:hypothetical protein
MCGVLKECKVDMKQGCCWSFLLHQGIKTPRSHSPNPSSKEESRRKELNQISVASCEWPTFRLCRVAHSDGMGKDGRREPCSRLGICSREDWPCIKPGKACSVVMLIGAAV